MLYDTHAWIEFFDGTEKGRIVKEMMETEQPAIAMASISELASWALKRGLEPSTILDKIEKTATVLSFGQNIAALAGEIHHQNKKTIPDWGMVDSMIYATALSNGLTLVTGDKHFADQPQVLML